MARLLEIQRLHQVGEIIDLNSEDDLTRKCRTIEQQNQILLTQYENLKLELRLVKNTPEGTMVSDSRKAAKKGIDSMAIACLSATPKIICSIRSSRLGKGASVIFLVFNFYNFTSITGFKICSARTQLGTVYYQKRQLCWRLSWQKENLSHKGKRYEADEYVLMLRISQRMFLIFCATCGQGLYLFLPSSFCLLPSALKPFFLSIIHSFADKPSLARNSLLYFAGRIQKD